jgi:hypothetical protein
VNSIKTLSIFLFFLLVCTACLPPRCKVTNCEIKIDHPHKVAEFSGTLQPNETPVDAIKRMQKKKVPKKKRQEYETIFADQEITGQFKVKGQAISQYYRGLPFYIYPFRKKFADPSGEILGKFRKIDEREVSRFRKPARFAPDFTPKK